MYKNRHKYTATPIKTSYLENAARGTTPTWFIWVLTVVILILAGIAYRALASRLLLITDSPIRLPVPLSNFPSTIGDWMGKDLIIPAVTAEYMAKNFADDFISRRYINSSGNSWADVYVVYCSSRPGGILGHQPLVCYPGHGWIHDNTEKSKFTSRAGRQIPCLIHRLHKPNGYEQIVILNFYILNGQITTSERDFSGLFGRRPNIAGDPARYVAQVQISSTLENSILRTAEDMTDLIFDFLPDRNGRVRAEYTNTDKAHMDLGNRD
ncbi:MAG: hypothetical protein A2167_01195 [Planctomycetes bacterium RBG_13_46_10]|nr:MAG: hypothetical protein A2167_01195 [Planctomycetes bacterium RBG_13_46_10]